MRNVHRTDCPTILATNCNKWENDLKKEIERCQRTGEKVDDRFYNKYNKKDVKVCLTKMYSNLCCYCESRINIVDFPHIEHRIPKRKHPDFCYDWNNLHLSCTQCNTSKGDKYNESESILDAVIDDPISDHLTYDFGIETIINRPKTIRGESTINDTDLNRDSLSKARTMVFYGAMRVITEINNNPNSVDARFKKKELISKIKGEYGSTIQWAIDSFLRE